MRRRSSDDDERGEDPDEEDQEEDEEPSGPPRRRPRPRRPRTLRPWQAPANAPHGPRPPRPPPEEDETEASEPLERPPPGLFHRVRRPVFYRARDAVWFEPLIALAIVVLILVSLYAYTDNWPPAYVIESDSMQHGLTDQVGLINTGDLVLAQKVNASLITPYFSALTSGYRTYGEFGDVILYHPNGDSSGAPIIHRALAYIEYNPGNRTYSIPSLEGQACGSAPNAIYRVSDSPTGCGTLGLSGELTLLRVGWMGATVNVTLTPGVLGTHSGFLTMGDNNFVAGTPPQGEPDQPTLSTLVESGWIVGVARGMIPWFGSIKLLLGGDAGMVPVQSWEWLGITLIGSLLAAMGIHYALRAEGIEDELRKEEEQEEDEDGERPPRRWRGLVPWRRAPEEDLDEDDSEEEEGPRGRGRPWTRRRPPHGSGLPPRGGRPRPSVGRRRSPHRRNRSRREEL